MLADTEKKQVLKHIHSHNRIVTVVEQWQGKNIWTHLVSEKTFAGERSEMLWRITRRWKQRLELVEGAQAKEGKDSSMGGDEEERRGVGKGREGSGEWRGTHRRHWCQSLSGLPKRVARRPLLRGPASNPSELTLFPVFITLLALYYHSNLVAKLWSVQFCDWDALV